MKKLIISLLIITVMVLMSWLLKDITIASINAKDGRFVKVQDEGDFEIYCDTKTKVLYLQSYKGIGHQGYGGITVLVDQDGKPLLYGEE